MKGPISLSVYLAISTKYVVTLRIIMPICLLQSYKENEVLWIRYQELNKHFIFFVI